MGYSAQMAIPLLLFVIFSIPRAAVGQASAATMEQVMGNFMGVVAQTGVFTQGQLADMRTIKDTFVSSLAQMEASGKTSKSMLNAMNMGFASSVAEIAIAEQGGGSLSDKTNAITDSLAKSFLQVTGGVPDAFIQELRNMITMFAQVSVNDVAGSASASAGAAAAAGAGSGAGPGVSVAAATGVGGQGYQRQQQSQQSVTTSVSSQAYGAAGGNFFIIILRFFSSAFSILKLLKIYFEALIIKDKKNENQHY